MTDVDSAGIQPHTSRILPSPLSESARARACCIAVANLTAESLINYRRGLIAFCAALAARRDYDFRYGRARGARMHSTDAPVMHFPSRLAARSSRRPIVALIE